MIFFESHSIADKYELRNEFKIGNLNTIISINNVLRKDTETFLSVPILNFK